MYAGNTVFHTALNSLTCSKSCNNTEKTKDKILCKQMKIQLFRLPST